MGTSWSNVSPPASAIKLTKRDDVPGIITQLNLTVWEFSRPPPSTVPEVDVVFFHGLQLSDYKEAFWRTWLSRDQTVLWPKTWLGESFPTARILSVSYDSSARNSKNDMDLTTIADNLIAELILSEVGVGQNSPVILVGHSFGGIVIKQFVLTCLDKTDELNASDVEKIKTFLGNCKGVFYYSTPHIGSRLADYVNRIPPNPITKINEPIVDLLKTLNTKTGRINNSFSSVRRKPHGDIPVQIFTRAVGESCKTEYLGLKARVVEDASARHDTDGIFYTVPDANHFDVCRPQNKKWCSSFINLRAFITENTQVNYAVPHDQT